MNSSNLEKPETYLNRLVNKPCQFSVGDIVERIERGEKEMEMGGGIEIDKLRMLCPRNK
ncbi:MAG: hypothetical protein LBR26_10790 [Prevotella sp.]|jgi:hypothetical protein|nr:hypothetical protein [Prevotella sp.]